MSEVKKENKCIGYRCGKKSSLYCPTCLKLGVKGAYFCDQSCFKENWLTHKILHITLPSSALKHVDPFNQKKYTGTLRAQYPLSPKRKVPDHIEKPDYSEDGLPKSELNLRGSTQIEVLDENSIKIMRKVSILAREVLDIAAAAIKPGITTDEIDRIVHEEIIKRDAYPSPLNYHNFPKSCCTSVNEVICHGIPDQRLLINGDIINIDITLYKYRFHADLNKTYFVGEVDEESKKLVNCARQCLDDAIAMVKPGALYRDLGTVIENTANFYGFSVVRTYCGHGIHKLFHCAPNVPHYSKNKSVGVMKAGHCFTIEPMINAGKWNDVHWPDDWTAVTIDGKRSAQFEHTILITETSCEILTKKI